MRQQNNFPHAHMQPSPMDIWSSRVVDMMCVAAKASVAESQKPETAAELHFALRLKWLSKPHFRWAFASWPIWCERVVCTVVSDWFATDWLGLTLSDHQERRGRVDLQKMPWSCPKILEAWLCRSSTSYSTNCNYRSVRKMAFYVSSSGSVLKRIAERSRRCSPWISYCAWNLLRQVETLLILWMTWNSEPKTWPLQAIDAGIN